MDALLQQMSGRELAEWQAFYELEAEAEEEARMEATVRQRAAQ